MELILNILAVAGLAVLAVAAWQCWKILKKGRENEKLSEKEVSAISARLTIIQICLIMEAAVTILRLFIR